MSALHCHRCGAFVIDGVVFLDDTEDGLYVVTDEPVEPYLHECRCGSAEFVVVPTGMVADSLRQAVHLIGAA